jgi:hypothetical protein
MKLRIKNKIVGEDELFWVELNINGERISTDIHANSIEEAEILAIKLEKLAYEIYSDAYWAGGNNVSQRIKEILGI